MARHLHGFILSAAMLLLVIGHHSFSSEPTPANVSQNTEFARLIVLAELQKIHWRGWVSGDREESAVVRETTNELMVDDLVKQKWIFAVGTIPAPPPGPKPALELDEFRRKALSALAKGGTELAEYDADGTFRYARRVDWKGACAKCHVGFGPSAEKTPRPIPVLFVDLARKKDGK